MRCLLHISKPKIKESDKDQYDNLSSVLKKMRDAEKISDLESLMSSSTSLTDHRVKEALNEMVLEKSSQKKESSFFLGLCACFSSNPKVKSPADMLAEELRKSLSKTTKTFV